MASLEQRGKRFRIVFRYQGKKYGRTLRTTNRREAEIVASGVAKTLYRVEQRLLAVPDGTDITSFLLSDGQVTEAPRPRHRASEPADDADDNRVCKTPLTTLKALVDRYREVHSIGAMEANSLATVGMHLNHVVAVLGESFGIQSLTLLDLQDYVHHRARKRGTLGRPLSPVTIRKELASFRAAWNWARAAELIKKRFPNRGLIYPKGREKPPFQTWAEVARKVASGGLSAMGQKELWDCVFLNGAETEKVLAVARAHARHGFIPPMLCFAAWTGARRSEMLRLHLADLDLQEGFAWVTERKRDRTKHTRRRIPLCPKLVEVLKTWLADHPGGDHVFCLGPDVPRSRTGRSQPSRPLTRNEAHDHFVRTLAGTEWSKLRGWHVFRHSFVSNCAAAGIDQRLIDSWVGHQTEDMRRRYRHLFPDREHEVIRSLFGDR